MIALGVIAAVWLAGRELERKGAGTTDDVGSIAIWAVGAGIIGARLYHVATDWERFEDNLGAIPKIWEGGLGIPGGLLFGVFAGMWQAKRRGIEPLVMLTCSAPAIRPRPGHRAVGELVQPGTVRPARPISRGRSRSTPIIFRRSTSRAPRSIPRSSTSRSGTSAWPVS